MTIYYNLFTIFGDILQLYSFQFLLTNLTLLNIDYFKTFDWNEFLHFGSSLTTSCIFMCQNRINLNYYYLSLFNKIFPPIIYKFQCNPHPGLWFGPLIRAINSNSCLSWAQLANFWCIVRSDYSCLPVYFFCQATPGDNFPNQ